MCAIDSIRRSANDSTRSIVPAPAIVAESPEAKMPVYASGQERRRSSLPAVAYTAVFAEDLQRKARLGAIKMNI
ncbi:MAG: hypothetical protein EA358_08605 [Flavobacteriales bacterium]|nr:MAG: hypothetical protein EA358_08605 [Flavobacteriales bacterium]